MNYTSRATYGRMDVEHLLLPRWPNKCTPMRPTSLAVQQSKGEVKWFYTRQKNELHFCCFRKVSKCKNCIEKKHLSQFLSCKAKLKMCVEWEWNPGLSYESLAQTASFRIEQERTQDRVSRTTISRVPLWFLLSLMPLQLWCRPLMNGVRSDCHNQTSIIRHNKCIICGSTFSWKTCFERGMKQADKGQIWWECSWNTFHALCWNSFQRQLIKGFTKGNNLKPVDQFSTFTHLTVC